MTNTAEFFRSLEQRGELFAEMEYGVVATQGFGASPIELISGVTPLPDGGAKVCLDSYGAVTGEINGTFNQTEYLHIHAGKAMSNNVHGVIVTEGGVRISLRLLGEVARDGALSYQVVLNHNSEAYSDLNYLHLFAKGQVDFQRAKAQLKVYAVATNPFGNGKPFYAGGKAFSDPDDSLVDYANFPFKLEPLQQDSAATLIYAGEGRLNGVEAFGADINAVFSGQVEIPEQGLRMNGYFSGPTAGSINGVISGRNFLRVMPDGSMRMNSKIIANTLEGETLLLEALGASFPQTFETSRAVSNLEKYAQLSQLYNVGVGSTDVFTQQIIYNHYGYVQNPFA